MSTFNSGYTLNKGKPKPPDPFGRISGLIDLISGLANTDYLVGNGSHDLVDNGNVITGVVLQQLGGCSVIQDLQDGQDQLGLSATIQVESLGISQLGKDTPLVWEGQAIATLQGINSSPINAIDFVSV